MRLYHLLVLLHFAKGLLKRNEKYAIQPLMNDTSCIKHDSLFLHFNISLFQCTTLCSNLSSCRYFSYIRDIGRCAGCDSEVETAFELGSRVFMKLSSDIRSDGPSECVGLTEGDGDSGRCPKKMLNVSNGGPAGSWYGPHFCQNGSYAIGYSLKIQENQLLLDDTAVNGLGLQCSSADHLHPGNLIVPRESEFGVWSGPENCTNEGDVLKAFQLQVEAPDEHNTIFSGTSAVNFALFKCGPLNSSLDMSQTNTLKLAPGQGPWGTFGNWSEQCDVGQGVCGLKVKIDSESDEDRTGLNDVTLYCC